MEGICSERKLVESASLILTHRKYLGYTFDEPLPDYSRVTRIRQWLGIEVFERFVERVVDLCWELVLVWGYDNGTGWFPLRALLHQSAAGGPLATQEIASISVRQLHDQFERSSVVMHFVLIAAMNPCPCGYDGDPRRVCSCAPGAIGRYQKRQSTGSQTE